MTDLLTAFQVPRGVTALVGGGGKTSLMLALGNALAARGRVLVTTTTHMRKIEGVPLIWDVRQAESAYRDLAARGRPPLLTAGMELGDGRLSPIADFASAPADYIIVEADGARMLPLKAPAAHEPALPPAPALVVAVAGIDGTEQPIALCAHRPHLYAALCEKPLDACATPRDIARVLTSRDGQFRGVTGRVEFFINKADTPARRIAARAVARCLAHAVVGSILEGAFELWRDGQCLL